MIWKSNESKGAVHGVDELTIPQFTIADYTVATTVDSCSTISASVSTDGAADVNSGIRLIMVLGILVP